MVPFGITGVAVKNSWEGSIEITNLGLSSKIHWPGKSVRTIDFGRGIWEAD
jgi:hypothetical protein